MSKRLQEWNSASSFRPR